MLDFKLLVLEFYPCLLSWYDMYFCGFPTPEATVRQEEPLEIISRFLSQDCWGAF